MVGKYNITTIKDKRSLLVKTSKEFPKKISTTTENVLQIIIIIIITKEKVTLIINQ